MILDTDTIVAIATPPGHGGIGVVRLSGKDAFAIAAALLADRRPLAAGRVRLAKIRGLGGEVLDEALVTCFRAPRSYTGEDVVEISAHGAPVLLEEIVRTSLAHGARLAEPGEFTQRAVLSGRLDLTQAEAVHDLVAARTLEQARVAARQLGGSLGRAVDPVKQELLDLIAQLEAGIDFAEDALDLLPREDIVRRLAAIAEPLRTLAATYSAGRLLHAGFTLALVGRPNVGKSSLFNRLLAQDRAIVTAQPGTTRDPVSAAHAIGGIPVQLFDTAGLRLVGDAPEHEPERLGIERSRMLLAEADLVLHVLDATAMLTRSPAEKLEDGAIARQLGGRVHLTVLNKCDLAPAAEQDGALRVSALLGQGIEDLRAGILSLLGGSAPAPESPMLTTLRQQEALAEALAAIERATANPHLHHELLLLDLYKALESLDDLTGATPGDAVLSRIFSTFCIGK